MILNPKQTFDELIARQAPDEESRDRVLNNPIYQQISGALAGSQEYMAMEKLFELHTEGEFDMLVLDTPPSRNALDFLEAPRRLTQFIEGKSLKVFMKPTGFAAKVAGRGATVALSVMKRIVGFDLMADLAEFFNAFSGMVDGFQARAKRVNKRLASAPAAPKGSRCRRPSTSTANSSRRNCPSAASSSARSTARPRNCAATTR